MTIENLGSPMRVMVVDNEPEPHLFVKDVLSDLVSQGRIELLHAGSEEEAINQHRASYLDLILLDLHFQDGELGGYEIIRKLEELGSSAEIIMMTHRQLGKDAEKVIRLSSRSERPHVIDFIKKTELERIHTIIGDLLVEYEAGLVKLANLDFATDLVASRRDRYPKTGTGQLRLDRDEVAVELRRLCDDLFGQVEGSHRSTQVFVELRPLERRGLSAAVTLKPVVRLSFSDVALESSGYDCVLKLGPVDDIQAEVARYQEYVRYGVQLEQRVELLAHSVRDALAGIVYSFAGGVYGDDLVSLDELLRYQEPALALEVIGNLFGTSHWYNVRATPKRIRHYLDSVYETDLVDALSRNNRSWENIARKNRDLVKVSVDLPGGDSLIQITDAPRLALPGEIFFGEGWSLLPQPRCLVHGDMHGGNVMAELGGSGSAPSLNRVCLIDYRNAGPGPRCIDAVALESSIRIADAESIARAFGVDGVSSLNNDDLQKAVKVAANRSTIERQLFEYLWHGKKQISGDGWITLSTAVVRGAQETFRSEPIDWEEYAQTVIYYASRQLGYHLDPVVRARISGWLSAVYTDFRKYHPRVGAR